MRHCFLGVLLTVGCGAAVAQTTTPTDAERLAAANADKAEWEAKNAALNYRNNSNPGSGLTGKVDVKANAGSIEANILAARAVERASAMILEAVNDYTSAVVILSPAASTSVARWDLFSFRHRRLTALFRQLSEDLETALSGVDASLRGGVTAEASPLLLLSLASKALSYGLSDYEIGGVATTSVTDETLATALSALGPEKGVIVSRPLLLPTAGGPDAVLSMVEGLEQQAVAATKERAVAKKVEAALLKKAEANGADAPVLKQQAAVFNALAARYDATLTASDALITMLGDAGEKNLLPLSGVVREKILADALDRAGWALFISSPASGGGYYTKKNLWTALGGMPFYVAGGATVNYTLVERATGDVRAAGVVSVLCGYRRVSDSPELACEHEIAQPPAGASALSSNAAPSPFQHDPDAQP
jgi:hypothetical protein